MLDTQNLVVDLQKGFDVHAELDQRYNEEEQSPINPIAIKIFPQRSFLILCKDVITRL